MGIAEVFLFVALSCAAAEPAAEATAATKIDFYLSAMLAERKKLRSGEFIVSGPRTVTNSARPQLNCQGNEIICCAFDDNRIRMDNHQPAAVRDPVNRSKMKSFWIERKFYRTPDFIVSWTRQDQGNEIAISRPDSRIEGPFLFFDVRGLGLARWHDMANHRDANHQWVIDGSIVGKIVAALKRPGYESSVDTSDPQFVQFAFVKPSGTRLNELRYWLRTDQGFAPAKLQARTRVIDEDDGPWEVTETAEVSWEQIDGVWVPVKFAMTSTEETALQTLAWKIRWLSVNKDLDARLFNWEDFAAPDDVNVVDRRGNGGILMQIGPVRKPGFLDERRK